MKFKGEWAKAIFVNKGVSALYVMGDYCNSLPKIQVLRNVTVCHLQGQAVEEE